jgi:hypothetical protein
MKRRWLLALIAANVAAVAVLAFAYPRQMLSPGALETGHAALSGDCFACHLPWRGANAEKCVSCHAVPDIGLRTVKKLPLVHTPPRTPFHQALAAPDCLACHSEHAVPRLVPAGRISFSHALLKPGTAAGCADCHAAPAGDFHRNAGTACVQCHSQTQWKPVTFDHSRFFRLDGDHNAPCATCHIGQVTKTYTCYGCHEHQPDTILAKHRRERITNVDNCVACHRGAHDGRERGEAEGGRGGDKRDRSGKERD